MNKICWKSLLINIAIPLILIGGSSAVLTMNSMNLYQKLNQPPLSPPGWIFPIVWTILFILMGISSYRIYEKKTQRKGTALTIYAIQLLLNLSWSIVFFNLQQFPLSIVIIFALLASILLTTYLFYQIDAIAAILFIPYIIWVIYAIYLNIGFTILN